MGRRAGTADALGGVVTAMRELTLADRARLGTPLADLKSMFARINLSITTDGGAA